MMLNSTVPVEQLNYVGHAVQLDFAVLEFNGKLLAYLQDVSKYVGIISFGVCACSLRPGVKN